MDVILGLFVALIILVLCIGFGVAVTQAVQRLFYGSPRSSENEDENDTFRR